MNFNNKYLRANLSEEGVFDVSEPPISRSPIGYGFKAWNSIN